MNDSGKKRVDNKILKQLDCKCVALSRILYEKSEDVKSLQALRAIAKQTSIENQGLDVQHTSLGYQTITYICNF